MFLLLLDYRSASLQIDQMIIPSLSWCKKDFMYSYIYLIKIW